MIEIKKSSDFCTKISFFLKKLYSQVAKEEAVSKVTVWEQMDQFVTAVSQLSRATDKPAPSGRLLLLHACPVKVPNSLGIWALTPWPPSRTHTPPKHSKLYRL